MTISLFGNSKYFVTPPHILFQIIPLLSIHLPLIVMQRTSTILYLLVDLSLLAYLTVISCF